MASSITRFKGLNNVTDPLRMGLGWLVRADNVEVSETGALNKREGYTLARTASGAIGRAFSTSDFARLYVVEGGNLLSIASDMTARVIAAGVGTAPMFFTEVNDRVYFNNGTAKGIIEEDDSLLAWDWPVPATPVLQAVSGALAAGLYQVRIAYTMPDGRLTGAGEPASILLNEGEALQIVAIPQVAGLITNVFIAPANSTEFLLAASTAATSLTWTQGPSALGRELNTIGLDPVPASADVIQAYGGRIYAAMFMPQEDQTAVWRSKPLAFHLFDLSADVFLVKGRVLMLAPTDKALVIGTDRAVHTFDGERLATVANYGVVPGQHWSEDAENARTLFWTTRGLCAALPFANLTEGQVSVPPGITAGGALMKRAGRTRYVATLQQGGSAFNPYRQ